MRTGTTAGVDVGRRSHPKEAKWRGEPEASENRCDGTRCCSGVVHNSLISCRQLSDLPKSSEPLLRHQLCHRLSKPCSIPWSNCQDQRHPSATPRLPLDVRPVSLGSVQLIRRSASPCGSREVTPQKSPGSVRHEPLLQLCMADNASNTALVDLAQGALQSQSRRFVLDNAQTELDDTRRFKSGGTPLNTSRSSGSL